MSRNALLSSRSDRKHFLWRWYYHKKKHKNVKIEIWFIVVCTLIDKEYASLLFSQTFFSYCFCMLSDFAKVFERKVWRVQVAHLHNAARALSSPIESVFSIANKSWLRFRSLSLIMWLKKTNRMWLSVALMKFHWSGINWHVFNQSECRNCCLYIIMQKIAPQAKSEKFFQIWFFPWFGGKKWRRSEHAHASYPGLFFRPPGFSPYMEREERRVKGLD